MKIKSVALINDNGIPRVYGINDDIPKSEGLKVLSVTFDNGETILW